MESLNSEKEALFLSSLLFIMGILWTFATPPNQVPDEQTHYLRRHAMAQGQWGFDREHDYPDDVNSFIRHFPEAHNNGYPAKVGNTMYNRFLEYREAVEKSEKAKGVDPNTVNKLKSKIETLKREKGELKKALKKSEDESGSLKKIVEQTQNDLENMRAEAEDLASRRSFILHDREIYEELYKWIAKAKSYIYIIAPFTGYNQIKKMKDEFLRATGKNKGLSIRILYGIQDRDKYGDLPEKTIKQLRYEETTIKKQTLNSYFSFHNF